ncbi:hypothetical protein DVH24_041786 [Malus domestica]|uniref:STAR protein homodimerisation region domain-containing protein n=1 Tax=Malus domestica TaxID=3750 RepID=A0A498IN99_MALDO|nr:hypothetical protein DVH24_041786 [Malus domestica]
MMPNQGFSDFDELQRGSPSPNCSDIMPNYRGSDLGEWPHDWTELLTEHRKLRPFTQVVPICGCLLNQEIIRVSGMMPNQGFSDFDTLQRGALALLAQT